MLRTIFSLGIAAFALLFKGCKLPEGMRNGYAFEDGKVVHYAGFPARRIVMEQADAASFKAINDNYGKDKHYVFLSGKVIENADPATFVFLGGSYSKDKNHGYTRDEIISTDAAHFEIVPNPEETPTNVTAQGIAYAKDSRYIYKGNFKITNADPATFEFVPMFNGYYVCRDKNYVFWQDNPLEGIDGQSFKRVSEMYFKDKNGVWSISLGRTIEWVPVPSADAETFTAVKRFYGRDKNSVFYENRKVEGADPATFEETENYGGKDKTGNYQSGVFITGKR
ncbi:DKNYY domain-containing protein [Runella sp.]|uniref:DKNYY domain-containing protein n=1 Tax=Runella sp. TaxID=1960881 RepID=UPI003D0FC8EF